MDVDKICSLTNKKFTCEWEVKSSIRGSEKHVFFHESAHTRRKCDSSSRNGTKKHVIERHEIIWWIIATYTSCKVSQADFTFPQNVFSQFNRRVDSTYPYKAPGPTKNFLLSEEKGMKIGLSLLTRWLDLLSCSPSISQSNLFLAKRSKNQRWKNEKLNKKYGQRFSFHALAILFDLFNRQQRFSLRSRTVSNVFKLNLFSLYSRSATASREEGWKLSDFPFALSFRIYRRFVHQHSRDESESNKCKVNSSFVI